MVNKKSFIFGNLELKVLQALKNIREGTIREILDEVTSIIETEDPDSTNVPAYTTIATVLTRLAKKHQVQVREERFRKNQSRLVYIYEDVESGAIDEMITKLEDTFGSKAIVRLAEKLTTKINPEALQLLDKKIQIRLEKEKEYGN